MARRPQSNRPINTNGKPRGTRKTVRPYLRLTTTERKLVDHNVFRFYEWLAKRGY